MENKQNQWSPVNSVDSCKALIGSSRESPDHVVKNDVFSEKEDSKNVEASDSDWGDSSMDSSSSSDSETVDLEWFVATSDDGPNSLSNWVDGPIEAKPILSVEPKYDFEVKPIMSVEPKCDFETKPIMSVGPKCNFEVIPVLSAKPKCDFEAKPIMSVGPKCDFEVIPVLSAKAKCDFEAKNIMSVGPKYNFEVIPILSAKSKCDFETKSIMSVEPKCDFGRDDEDTKPGVTSNVSFVNHTFKGAGLVNLGNTCFLNAVLQCFMHTVHLFELLLFDAHVTPCDIVAGYMGFCVICVFKELIGLSLAYEGGSISPSRLVDNLSYFSAGFHRYQQEDAHEFLQCFLDRLESHCSDNIVKQVFGGRLVSKLCCCNCGRYSNTYEPLIDVSLEIKDVDSLHSALDSFTRVEKLDDPKIKFSCEKCKAQVSIEKQLMLDNAPSVAVFHLKRFQNDGSVVQKVDKHVSFPLELDLLPYTENNQTNNEEMKYDLYAVIVHAGSTSCSGHYYSFIRPAPNEWYKFDDSEVSRVHDDLVLAEEAYIIFYAKRGTLCFSDFVKLELNTSFQTVLDNHASNVSESNAAADDTIPILCKERHSVVSDVSESNVAVDKTLQASNPGPTGAINSSDSHELNEIADNESKETVPTSTPGPTSAINISNSHADGVDEASFPDQVASEDQLQMDPEEDTEIRLACSLIKKRVSGSRGEELIAALRRLGGESSLNEKRRKNGSFSE